MALTALVLLVPSFASANGATAPVVKATAPVVAPAAPLSARMKQLSPTQLKNFNRVAALAGMTPKELEADLRAKVAQRKVGPTLASRSRADEKIDAAKLVEVMKALPTVLEGGPNTRPPGRITRVEVGDVEYNYRFPEGRGNLLAPQTWKPERGGVGWHAQVATRVTYKLPEGGNFFGDKAPEQTIWRYSRYVPTRSVKPAKD